MVTNMDGWVCVFQGTSGWGLITGAAVQSLFFKQTYLLLLLDSVDSLNAAMEPLRMLEFYSGIGGMVYSGPT